MSNNMSNNQGNSPRVGAPGYKADRFLWAKALTGRIEGSNIQ